MRNCRNLISLELNGHILGKVLESELEETL